MTPLLILALPFLACTKDDDDSGGADGGSADGGGGDGGDTGDGGGSGDGGADPAADCEALGLPIRPFDPTAPSALRRHEPSGDLSVPLVDGSTWTLSEQYSGCDSYVFLPNWWPISDLDDDSWWDTDLEDLLDLSPKNAHYFFVVGTTNWGSVDDTAAGMQAKIDETLLDLDEADRDWWSDRLHVVAASPVNLEGLVGDMFSADIGMFGFAIDRRQRIRTLGYMAAVDAYDSALNNAGYWPWEMRLYPVAHEVAYFEYEAQRQARLDAEDATVVPIFGGDVVEMYVDGKVELPDAATMQGFDTLEIDVDMQCPNPELYEPNNCGAWDYIANLWLLDEDGKTWLEMGRFITTYHRESHWVVDATSALAWLQEGGTRSVRYSWAPEWNTQPTGVTVNLRLSNQGKGMAPREIVPLFTGGAVSTTYNDRAPVEVAVPADAAKVELVAIITGHGMDANNCAEFCNIGHHFSVGGKTWSLDFPEASTDSGCEETVGTGTVPNQAGTWWFGRGGWCPGRQVDPFKADVTAQAPAGGTASFTYMATLDGGDLIDGAGNIEMRSWAVIWR